MLTLAAIQQGCKQNTGGPVTYGNVLAVNSNGSPQSGVIHFRSSVIDMEVTCKVDHWVGKYLPRYLLIEPLKAPTCSVASNGLNIGTH